MNGRKTLLKFQCRYGKLFPMASPQSSPEERKLEELTVTTLIKIRSKVFIDS